MTTAALPPRIGKYEVIGVVGRGGMGVVYSARDPFIDRIVAVKTIAISSENEAGDDQVERLRMEARSAGKLHHPNIVTIFDFGEEGDLSYIVMEYVEGINLSRVVQMRRAIPLAAKVDVLIQVARGLAYAHECGVIHRDMKPSNVCVTLRGVAKILDFGLARFDDTKLTKTGYLSGTIAYMSPERFNGETGPLDDIFAFGAVAYELLSYERAFPGDSTPQIIAKILGGPMPAPVSELTGYPPALDEIVQRALQREPQLRYANAAQIERDLVQFTASDEYRTFVAQEIASSGFQGHVDWADPAMPANNQNPYSSAKHMDSVPASDMPTLAVTGDAASVMPTDVGLRPDDPTIPSVKKSPNTETLASTQISPATSPRKNPMWMAMAAAAVIVVAGAVVVFRKHDSIPQQPPTVAATRPAPLPPVDVPATTSSSQPADLSIAQKSETTVAVEASTSQQPVPAVKTPAPHRKEAEQPEKSRESAAVPTVTMRIPTPAPAPVETRTVSPEAPAPVPRKEAAPAAQTSRADLERDIRTFLRDVARAYQEKDVSFFRQHSLNLSDAQDNAIHNSPSTAVQMSIMAIDWIDDQNVNVRVKRTDTFAERGMPPGVQMLVYELRRTPNGWKIVSFRRA